jgi:hypothetical protein
MSVKILEGPLEILELLLFLDPTQSITSREIRQKCLNNIKKKINDYI